METVGRILLLIIGIPMAASFPLSELARGMATNPSQHRKSGRAALLSMVGVAGIAAAVFA